MLLTGAEIVVECLKEQGVDTVFGYPGGAILNIFSGMIAPISLFPEFLQKIANFLPFKDCIYTPINIYFGKLSTTEIMQIMLKQCLWIILLYAIAKFVFHKAIKNITINGG